jgi:hypothetical protein
MELSLRLMLVVTVLMITAVIGLGILTGEAEGFTDFLDRNSKSAECGLWETKYERAETGQEKQEISNEAPDKCGDIGGGGETGGDDPGAGTCEGVEEQKNCYEGTCEWTGSECIPK